METLHIRHTSLVQFLAQYVMSESDNHNEGGGIAWIRETQRTHISLDKNSNTEFYTEDILSSLNSSLQIHTSFFHLLHRGGEKNLFESKCPNSLTIGGNEIKKVNNHHICILLPWLITKITKIMKKHSLKICLHAEFHDIRPRYARLGFQSCHLLQYALIVNRYSYHDSRQAQGSSDTLVVQLDFK